MRLVIVTLLSLLSFAPSAAAQNPDYSGRWVAISPGFEGREVRITKTRTTLKVIDTLNGRAETVVYNLDGTPRREQIAPGEEHWSVAAWNDGTLTLTSTRLSRSIEQRTDQTLSFDTARRLILSVNRARLDTNRDSSAALPVPSKTVIVLKKRTAGSS